MQPPSCQSHYSCSHHARFDVLTHALGVVVVVMVVVGSAGRWVEGGDAVEVEHEVLPVAHRRVALVARDANCEQTESRAVTLGCAAPGKGLSTETLAGWIYSIQVELHSVGFVAGLFLGRMCRQTDEVHSLRLKHQS